MVLVFGQSLWIDTISVATESLSANLAHAQRASRHFKEFWPRLREDILSARDSIYIQTFALEGDPVWIATLRSPAVITCSGQEDSRGFLYAIVLSDRFRYWPANFFDRNLRDEARSTSR